MGAEGSGQRLPLPAELRGKVAVIAAYFCDGPHDLTKVALHTKMAPTFYYFAKMPEMPLPFTGKVHEMELNLIKLRYRLAYLDHRGSYTPCDHAFYIYDGEEG